MNEGKKNDFLDKKLRWDLLPLEEIEDIVEVYTKGAEKYSDNSWQNLENGLQRYKAALLRHLVAYEKGEEFDEETHCKHLAQVAWNAIAMLWLSKHKKQDNKGTSTVTSTEESTKHDELLKALDERIESGIQSMNDILDEAENKVKEDLKDNEVLNFGKKLRSKDIYNVDIMNQADSIARDVESKYFHIAYYDKNDSAVFNECYTLHDINYNEDTGIITVQILEYTTNNIISEHYSITEYDIYKLVKNRLSQYNYENNCKNTNK